MYDFFCPYCSWSMSREDINDYVARNEVKGVDVKLPFTILQSLKGVS